MYPKSHNPFADDDEDTTPTASSLKFSNGDKEESTMNPENRRQRQLEQEVMNTAQSAMDSSSRSLCLIYDSEKIGTKAAEVRILNYLSAHKGITINSKIKKIF